MEDKIIKFEGVSKKFCKDLRRSMYYGVKDVAKNIFGIPSRTEILRDDEFWALDDVSFEVRKGETLGVIGPNGAGKTTILKLIAGILYPDRGRVEVDGKVGSLIEIGAGFHPNLTGRENIYVNGAILGMSKKEIDRKINDIIEFADIGDFINSPVKYYSAGMYVRLGFSIAVHSEPEILLVDEVLAVGDEEFQRRCVAPKIREFLNKGITIVFVSHNLGLVQAICKKTMWIEKGRVKKVGSSGDIISQYLLSFQKTPEIAIISHYGPIPISKEAEIIDYGILNSKGERVNNIYSGEETIIFMKVKFHKKIENPHFGLTIKNENREIIYRTTTLWHYIISGLFENGEIVEVEFKQKMLLREGNYYISFAVAYSEGLSFCDWKDEILNFRVIFEKKIEGILNLNSEVVIIRLK